MPYHVSRGDDLDQATVTKPKIIKNWLILGSCVLAFLALVTWLLWPKGKTAAGPTAPELPPDPVTGVAAPRDDAAACTFLGVTVEGRYVVGTWKRNLASEKGPLAEDRPAIEGKDDSAGIEIWDRQKGTRLRKNCVDEVFFDPTGTVTILQELAKSSVVHRLAVDSGTVTKVLDTAAADFKDDTFVKDADRRLFVSSDGRLGVAFSKKASGELSIVQWDLSTGQIAHRIKLEPGSELVGVSDDGRRAAVRQVDKKLVQVCDLVAEKMVVTASIGNGYFAKEDTFLKSSPFLPDHRSFCLRIFNLPEDDPNARWSLQYFHGETGKPVEVGTDEYFAFDAASGLWLRARDGLIRQTSWELVKSLGRDALIQARLNLSPAYKVRRACFVPGKGQVACYCEIAAETGETAETRRMVQVFELRNGNLFGEVNRPTNPQLDGNSLLATANGAGLLFLSKLGKDDRLEMWKITAKPLNLPRKKPTSPAKDKVEATKPVGQ